MPKFLTLTLLLTASISSAQITSTFNTNDEGWTAAFTDGTVATFEYLSTGGNPGGHLSASPPTAGGSVNQSMNWYWVAPSKFLGKNDFSYGKHLKFDLKQSTVGTDNIASDIILRSGNQTIHLRFPEKPGTDWTSYSIPLDITADWRSNSAGGPVAYEHQIRAVLANITVIQIRCKWINTPGYTSQIDNVVLEQFELEPAPSIVSFTPVTASTGATVTINGTNFGGSVSTNRVFFGNKEATVATANTTQLQVTVPEAALFAPVRVLNTTTGLSAQSATSFQPQFNNQDDTGGRITSSTFGLNVMVPYAADVLASVMGDIDGDGWLDVATLERGATIGIFRHAGLGGEIDQTTFDPRMGIPSGEIGEGNSGGLMLVDFDNDGKPDLVTYMRGRFDGFSNSGGIAISRNISTPGNIVFEPARRFFELNIFFNGFAVADLDGDGRQDILINSSGLRVFQNTSTPGNIQFGVARNIHGTSGYVAVSDLNGDGKPEVISVGPSNTNIVYENESTPGNIVITPAFSFPGSMVSGITAADLDGDGKQDLTFYRINGFNDYDLVVRKNIHTTGPVTEASLAPEIILSKINRAYSQRVADINGDNRPEIILMGVTTSFVVFENATSPGTLTQDSFIEEMNFQAGIGLNAPQIGDLNGDNKPDVVAFGSGGGGRGLVIYQNESVPKPTISVNTVSPLRAVAGSTITITGEKFSEVPEQNTVWFGGMKANVLMASKTELTVEAPAGSTYAPVGVTRDRLTSYYHQPFSATFSAGVDFENSHFAPPVTIALAGADYDIDVGDMNNDGLPDLVVEINNAARIFRNTYTSGDITADALTLDVSITGSFLNPKLHDFDGDGLLDVATANGVLHKNIFNTGTIIEYDANVNAAISGSNLAFADFNLDGKIDMAAPSTGVFQLLVRENRTRKGPFTTGTFSSFSTNISFAKPHTNGGIVTADFDQDGWPDIAVTNPNAASMSIYHNQQLPRIRAGSFARSDIPTGVNPGRIYTGDFDNDGRQDLLLYHGTGANNTLLILLHNQSTPGNIVFERIDLTNPSATTVAHISDVDGDGRVDILTTSESGNRFSIFKNIHTSGALSAASFAAPFNTTVTAPRAIVTADLNVDGKPEIVITRTGFLAIYENLIPIGPTISINPQPTSVAVCDGETTSFTLGASGATNLTYQWQKFDGTVFNNVTNDGGYTGATTSTLSINTTGNFGSGDYQCLIKGDLAPDRFSNTATLTVNAVPAAPTANGNSNCIPAAITLSASGGTNGQYRWYDASGAIIPAQVNSTYVTPVISTTTNYSVAINNGLCESPRVQVAASIVPLTKPTIASSLPIVNNAINICDGEDVVLAAPNGFAGYTWSSGASTQQITVNTTGTYSFTVTDASSCVSPSSDPVTVSVNPHPLAEITPNGTQLTASPGDGHQWYHNGNPVSGATNQSYHYNALEYGVYAVAVTSNGCTTTSNDFVYLITGFENPQNGLKVYPNPVEENLFVEFNPPYTIQVMDITGNVIQNLSIQSIPSSLDFSAMAKGIYFLKIKNETQTQYLRIIKK